MSNLPKLAILPLLFWFGSKTPILCWNVNDNSNIESVDDWADAFKKMGLKSWLNFFLMNFVFEIIADSCCSSKK